VFSWKKKGKNEVNWGEMVVQGGIKGDMRMKTMEDELR
jgi:hypothetical protein